ncbi:hypothetical protein ATO12_19380 [Aquimarina atlantica]|uniref:Uncharacterized protein n=2 Tax=Aquimarina atlantica TaxID=1317122 RepID=A0A023BT68_9FLAO|nr:hypothetical protein ATO12_19380 [Aquimarina atlantica]
MRKVGSIFFWSIFIIICGISVFRNIVMDSKFFNKHVYDSNYNDMRLQNGIMDLPDTFIYTEDDYYKDWLIWENPNPIYNDTSYTHLKKMIKIDNSNLILENDLLKKINEDSLNYETINLNFYYDNGKHIMIHKNFENGVVTSIDTTNISLDFLLKN